MTFESWIKVGLPAYPVAFTIFAVWLYWGDNPLPLLAPSIAFWGVVILFYIFTHCEPVISRFRALFLIVGETVLWSTASITSHNLGRFLLSKQYTGYVSVLSNKDFLFAYACSLVGCAVGLFHFFKWEPVIMAQIIADRREHAEEQEL
jgi:hypothetical protein